MQAPGSNTADAPAIALTVNGGKLTATGESGDYKLAVYSYTNGNSMANVSITVNGGVLDGDIALTGGKNKTETETVTFTGGTITDIYSYASDDVAAETINVSGGMFVNPVAEVYCANGYIPKDNGDGSYGVKTGKYLVALYNADGELVSKFEDILTALDAAVNGESVKLLANVDIHTDVSGYIIVGKNVAIDLNGYELWAKGLIEFEKGSVIDTGATKGLLRVPNHRLVMTEASYPMLPVWNGEGYIFVTVKEQSKLTASENGNGFELIFRPSLDNNTALNTEVFGDGATDNGLTVVVDLKLYKDGHLMATESFVFEDDLLASVYASNAKVLKLTVRGINTFEKVVVEYKIISDTGLVFTAEAGTVVPTPPAPVEAPVEEPTDDPVQQ
jgi:hypothetical protein